MSYGFKSLIAVLIILVATAIYLGVAANIRYNSSCNQVTSSNGTVTVNGHACSVTSTP